MFPQLHNSVLSLSLLPLLILLSVTLSLYLFPSLSFSFFLSLPLSLPLSLSPSLSLPLPLAWSFFLSPSSAERLSRNPHSPVYQQWSGTEMNGHHKPLCQECERSLSLSLCAPSHQMVLFTDRETDRQTDRQ